MKMESLVKNDYISKQIKSLGDKNLENLIDEIEGDITLDKIYQKIFSRLNVNLYKSKNGKFYIELKKYIENISKITEQQILNHKYSVNKNKIIKLKDLEIQESYTVNKLTGNKKLIEINGLQTINDSIKRTNNEKNLNFLNWESLCQTIIINLPKLLEVAIKNYFKKEFDKINNNFKEQNQEIELLKKQNIKLENKINSIISEKDKIKKDNSDFKKNLEHENILLKKQLEEIKDLINSKIQ